MWCIGLLALNGVFHALLFAAALLPDQTVLLAYGLAADAFATGVAMLLMLITGIVFIVWFLPIETTEIQVVLSSCT